MDDETVVKVLQESRDAVRKCIGMLEQEQGFGPITGVYIANYKLLLNEIDDAIIYLGKDRSVVCDACSCDVTPENCGEIYCKTCIEDSEGYDEYQ